MQILILSIIAGVFGTGLGGFIATFVKNNSEKTMCGFLSFAGGIMISIVTFGLIPESIEISNIFVVILGILSGIVLVMFLNRIVDIFTDRREEKLKVHETQKELFHQEMVITNRKPFLRAGIIMLIAIGLHNLPEGIAIGASGVYDINFGILLTIMIALHNIPEGIAIAAPLIAGKVNPTKVILLTTLSGTPTLIGASIGMLLGNISDNFLAFSLSLAGGAMLYVVFSEILPQVVLLRKDRFATNITLLGMIIGLLMAQI